VLYRLNTSDVNPVPRITGRNLAHGRRTASQRAAIAAELRLGERVIVKPAEKQCAALVKVSVPYLRLAAALEPELRRQVTASPKHWPFPPVKSWSAPFGASDRSERSR
jgi:hypothetical protein